MLICLERLLLFYRYIFMSFMYKHLMWSFWQCVFHAVGTKIIHLLTQVLISHLISYIDSNLPSFFITLYHSHLLYNQNSNSNPKTKKKTIQKNEWSTDSTRIHVHPSQTQTIHDYSNIIICSQQLCQTPFANIIFCSPTIIQEAFFWRKQSHP